MMRKLAVAATLAVGAYAVWPYASLYEMRRDVQAQNVSAITADIDWDKLRDGLKQDIADGITGEPGAVQVASASAQAPGQVASTDDDLPPFGSGFVSNMADTMVEQTVTPQHLASTAATLQAAGAQKMAVSHAFFTSPTSFVVSMKAPSAGASQPGIKLRMDLVRSGFGMRWKVTRAWLPPAMLAAAEPHSS